MFLLLTLACSGNAVDPADSGADSAADTDGDADNDGRLDVCETGEQTASATIRLPTEGVEVAYGDDLYVSGVADGVGTLDVIWYWDDAASTLCDEAECPNAHVNVQPGSHTLDFMVQDSCELGPATDQVTVTVTG
jgi:hypothetical protein